MGPAEVPRWVLPVDAIPAKGIGKPDRAAARALAARMPLGDAEPDVAEVRPVGTTKAGLAESPPELIQDSTDTRTDERGE